MINEDYTSMIAKSERFGISVPTVFAWRNKILLSLPEISDKLSKKTILISDKHKSIGAYAKVNKISHFSFKAKDHTNSEEEGVQLLNSIAERIAILFNRRFEGVLTEYLQLYVNWFKFKENHKGRAGEVDMQNEILSRKHTWDLYSNIEKVYESFI